MPRESSVAPKERVNIVYRPATGDASEEVELPLKILVMGDFTMKDAQDIALVLRAGAFRALEHVRHDARGQRYVGDGPRPDRHREPPAGRRGGPRAHGDPGSRRPYRRRR